MMKKLIVLISFFTFTSFVVPSDDVYICNSKSASKYHYSETCRGLKGCKHEVVKMTLKEAKGKGFTLCGFED